MIELTMIMMQIRVGLCFFAAKLTLDSYYEIMFIIPRFLKCLIYFRSNRGTNGSRALSSDGRSRR